MPGIFPASGVGAEGAQNSTTVPVTAGCAPLWHSTTRCAPRFDPAAANAVMSEILNVMKCADLPYDCTKLDNLCTAIRDMIAEVDPDAFLYGCLPRTFPLSAGCLIEPLALSTDEAGCRRITRLNAAAARHARGTVQQAHGISFGPQLTPPNLAAGAYYTQLDLRVDQQANAVQEPKLAQSLIACAVFTLPCDMTVRLSVQGNMNFQPGFNGGAGGIGIVVPRIDGAFRIVGGTNLVTFEQVTNFESTYRSDLDLPFTAGAHTICIYNIAFSDGSAGPPAQAYVFSLADGSGNWSFDVSTAS